ncbi:MAG TPA: hypothetical protein V6C91_12020 [Coleofasciculaceae cyanobacterium]
MLSKFVISDTDKLPNGSVFRFRESIEENLCGKPSNRESNKEHLFSSGLAIALFVNSCHQCR